MRIAAITTSRADWNSLGAVVHEMQELGADVVCYALADHAGRDAVIHDAGGKVVLYGHPMPPPSMSETAKLFFRNGQALTSLGGALEADQPDMAVVCGDRHETLQAAFCAAVLGIQLAHLAGGDTTPRSTDDRWRHAITKIADYHFPTTWAAAERLVRMGEHPSSIQMLGSGAATRLLKTPIMPLAQLTKALQLPDSRPFLLVNFQPDNTDGVTELAQALFDVRMPVVWVAPNPDLGQHRVMEIVSNTVKTVQSMPGMPAWQLFENLPPIIYISALNHCAALVGNSSSGFYEAPYFGTPVINIGSRQLYREPVPDCMVMVAPNAAHIASNLRQLPGRFPHAQPFGGVSSAFRIADAILKLAPPDGWRYRQKGLDS